MKVLVTGGGGFLGRYVVEQLLDRGDNVRVFARGNYPELLALGAEVTRGDVQDAPTTVKACKGMDVVFHIAAKAGHWGSLSDYYGPNVNGTANIIAGCHQHEVRRLVYCSSPSVIFDNTSHEGVDESYPYPSAYESPYPHTKALGEQLVLKANSPELLTVALRPHLVIGPRDNHLLPALLRAAQKGFFPQVGAGKNRVDLTFVEDAARAHILAADHLESGSPVAGSVYFISQGEPVLLWPWIQNLLGQLGYPPIRFKIPLSIARALGILFETAHRTLPFRGEPRLTRFLASELAQSHWYDISHARRDLGYQPKFSMDQVLEKTLESLRSEE